MRYYGVVGEPITHSLSPTLFNSCYCGKDVRYIALQTASTHSAWRMFEALKLDGINITSPLKSIDLWSGCFDTNQAVINGDSNYKTYNDAARVLGVANTLKRNADGAISLYNTDVAGAVYGVNGIEGKRVAIIGGGGAALAARYAFEMKGAKTTILNRTVRDGFVSLDRCDEITAQADIIVNTLKVKIIDNFCDNQLFIDAIYGGAPYGCFSEKNNYIGGVNWLIGQAIPAYEIFTTISPSRDIIESVKAELSDGFNIIGTVAEEYDLKQNSSGRNVWLWREEEPLSYLDSADIVIDISGYDRAMIEKIVSAYHLF